MAATNTRHNTYQAEYLAWSQWSGQNYVFWNTCKSTKKDVSTYTYKKRRKDVVAGQAGDNTFMTGAYIRHQAEHLAVPVILPKIYLMLQNWCFLLLTQVYYLRWKSWEQKWHRCWLAQAKGGKTLVKKSVVIDELYVRYLWTWNTIDWPYNMHVSGVRLVRFRQISVWAPSIFRPPPEPSMPETTFSGIQVITITVYTYRYF
jgi:hypothetical protein